MAPTWAATKDFFDTFFGPSNYKMLWKLPSQVIRCKKYFIYYGRRIRKPAKNYILGTTDTKSLSIFAKKKQKTKNDTSY